MKEREESSSIFIVGERIYNVKFNLMLKLGFLTITGCPFWNIFFPPRGGLGSKGCVGHTLMTLSLEVVTLKALFRDKKCVNKLSIETKSLIKPYLPTSYLI